jgi:phosphohistidine phosphatase
LLAREGNVFELVLASSAPRALATAECVAAACNYDGRIRAERSLYLAPEQLCLKTLRALPAQVSSVLFVGHNPGLSALARALSGRAHELAPAEYTRLVFDLEDWSELD